MMNKSYLKRGGRLPTNPQLAEILHSLELGETIRVLGTPKDSAEIRRLVGSLNRTIKRKGACLSYRKGSGNRNYITCIRNVHPRTIGYRELEPQHRLAMIPEEEKQAFVRRMQKMLRKLGMDVSW